MNKKTTKKSTLTSLFLKTAIVTFIFFSLAAGGAVWAYNSIIYTPGGDIVVEDYMFEEPLVVQTEEEIIANEIADEINKTIAVFGTDIDGYRTDTILIVNFNSVTDKVKVVSVPRDTKVQWTSAQRAAMAANRGYSMSETKLNEMTAYADVENIRDFTIKQIELLLGIKIDNYVVVPLSAFRDVIDAIDGVTMNVPTDMYYVDNFQGLYINLEEGYQTLDGRKAEMLVRYRGYYEGDIQRISVQQEFLEAFSEKVLSPSIIKKIPDLVSVFFTSVRTDASILDVLSYSDYVKNIKTENITFDTIPGEGLYIGGVSYFIPDMDEMDQFVKDVFFDHVNIGNADRRHSKQQQNTASFEATTNYELSEETEVDRSLAIQILNASDKYGAENEAEQMLEQEGYYVCGAGPTDGGDLYCTQINVRDFNVGLQFKKYYPEGVINVDKNLAYDVQIVLY
ncbi:MAG: hypothetical protein BEN18_02020 [Epulopiscium sp. Nuni2H_MBin001]|nr:MAG: hypothetical protein BEN18_02020 [Epulopiscium sp. Nuni2H_MBin001]